MDAASFSTRNHLARMADLSWFDLFGRTSPRNSAHFEQSFSDDGGKTWKVNWITDRTLVKMKLSKRTEVRRLPGRGSHDWETIQQARRILRGWSALCHSYALRS